MKARKIVVSEFVSLDGVMEDPQWTAQFNIEEQNLYKLDELKSCDALLLGRVTYEGFASAWPKMTKKVIGVEQFKPHQRGYRGRSFEAEAAAWSEHSGPRELRTSKHADAI
jgi:dihydrofolate reductase